MPPLRFARVERSPVGALWVAETDAGVAACSRSLTLEDFLAGLRRRFPDRDLEPGAVDVRWLQGGSTPRLDLTGLPPFDAHVYSAVRDVLPGETITYGEVARLVGSPGAARAVGGAMARCPLFPAVPCHRVVRAADGWSGWGGDVGLKRRLLQDERRAARR